MDFTKLNFLNSFFKLFEAKLEITNVTNDDIIYGTLRWVNEEETQDFKWSNVFDNEALEILKDLCDYLLNNRLTNNDKIVVSEEVLVEKLESSGWNSNKIKKGIDSLMTLEVKMLDDGQETDSFFIHF